MGALIILKSFISQELKRGFASAEISSMNTSHSTLLEYLVETLGSMLETKDCSVLLVVDSVQHMVKKDIDDFLESLNCLTKKHAKRCSVLLGGETTVQLKAGLDGLLLSMKKLRLKVEPYSRAITVILVCICFANPIIECLESLYDDGYHARRDEIALAIGNSNQWVWNHPVYKAWEIQPSGALAIRGKPGSGKSVLAKTIQRKFTEHLSTRIPQGFESKYVINNYTWSSDFSQRLVL
jgi:Cdc6-like AAA superfamily ATPase